MKKIWLLKVLAITFIIFISHILIINNALALMPSSSIGFDINESISDASYLQFKIEAAEHYTVTMCLEDGDGETIKIRFSSQDDYDPGDYKLNEEEDRLTIYFSSSTITYESEPFEDLISLFLSEDDDSIFDLTDDPEITKIQINGGMYFNFYSIALADNEDFDDPCWSKDAADWSNRNDFISDGGDPLPYNIQFYTTYIHVTNTPSYSSPSYSSPTYFPWGMSNTGWNQPYFGGYQQPYNPYRDQQSYFQPPFYGNNFGSSPFGYQQPPYGYYQPPTLANDMIGYPTFNNPYGVGYQQPSYPYGTYGTPYGNDFGFSPFGYQQSSDPYGPGYQQPPLYDIPSFNDNEYWDPYRNTWMVYDEWNNMTYEKPIPYNGNPNPYPSPWGSSGPGVVYVGYPPPTPKLSYLRI